MSVQPSDIALSVRNLRVGFANEQGVVSEVVKGVSFDIAAETTTALVGESGSGKSVTALATMGLLPAFSTRVDASSQILFNGVDLQTMDRDERRALCGRDLSMIFQEPMSSLNPVFPVGFQIGEVLRFHRHMSKAAARARCIELLEEVGIPEPHTKIDAFPNQMSGGQLQRVMIAMALACEPKLLIADEPTTALDVTIQRQIVDLIADLQKRRRMAVLFITHDLGLVSDIAHNVVVMRHGVIREMGETRSLFANPQDAYTQALLQCRPNLGVVKHRLPTIDQFLQGEGLEDGAQRAAPVDQGDDAARRAQAGQGGAGAGGALLQVRDLKKTFYQRKGLFGRHEIEAVKGVSFDLERGKTLGLVGESGSGKTTVGLMLLRLHEATGGQVQFDGKQLLAMNEAEFQPYKRRMQIIFQNPYASLNPRLTIGEILLEPLRIHHIGANDAERLDHVKYLLQRVGLPQSALGRYPHEFSGGQRQRIAIARCLTLKPELLVCDESVSALDVSVQAQVLNLLKDLQDEFGMTYVFISHDLAVVKHMADHLMVMQHGQVVEFGPSAEVYANPKQDYTRRLIAAVPGQNSPAIALA